MGGLLLFFEAILKAVLLTLGIMAVKGTHWALVTFIVLLVVLILVDLVVGIVAIRNGKDVKRWEL